MMNRTLRTVLHGVALAALGAALSGWSPADAQGSSSKKARMSATEMMIDSETDEELSAYAETHLAPEYRDSFGDEGALLAFLRSIRDTAGPIGGVGVMGKPGRIELHIENGRKRTVVGIDVASQPPHLITGLEIVSSEDVDHGPALSWDELGGFFEDAESDGFCGSVLAVRDGEVVLEESYGYVDPDRTHPVTAETVFAIGSTPIDFTHGGVLLLESRGKLDLDDTLPTYFDDVPADKQSITLEMLRTGQSGLLDFPGIPGVDENMDLSWIDRDEFLRRVWASELRFAPGTDEKHSHAAWGVLAAVIEVVSGEDYEAFLRENMFEPAGMTRTGHYPLAATLPPSEVAVGLGGNTWGEVNSPAHWGKTSWLVLGSGGMISTPRDLWRWRHHLASGQAFGEKQQTAYGLRPGAVFVAEGGNDRGFINTIGARDADIVIVCSNSHVEMHDEAKRVAMAAARIVG